MSVSRRRAVDALLEQVPNPTFFRLRMWVVNQGPGKVVL